MKLMVAPANSRYIDGTSEGEARPASLAAHGRTVSSERETEEESDGGKKREKQVNRRRDNGR